MSHMCQGLVTIRGKTVTFCSNAHAGPCRRRHPYGYLREGPLEGEASPLAEADLHIRQPSRDTRDSRGSYGGACA